MSEKKLDVICLGAAVVDIPLRPVSRDMFDIESYPVAKKTTLMLKVSRLILTLIHQ